MMKPFLKKAFRQLFRKKSNAWINILGLALGLFITMLIWMHVLYERSYDRFFDGHRHIYRVQNTVNMFTDEPLVLPTAMFSFADRLQQFPQVLQAVRLSNLYFRNPALQHEDRMIYTSNIAVADPGFFKMFSLQFLAGDPQKALKEPASLVLTHSLAANLFEDPLLAMDQMVQLNNQNYRVTAIIQDVPENSHMAFNGLVSWMDIPEQPRNTGFGHFTYLKLAAGTDIQALEKSLSEVSNQALQENPYFELKTARMDTRLKNLAHIHLTSNLIMEMKPNGSLRNVRIFSLISIFIMLLAIINYVNLATARSSLRAREIGMRKVAGSSRSSLIRLFMAESFITTLLAFVLALFLAEIFSVYLSGQLGITMWAGSLFSPGGWLILALLLVFTATMAGLYPALYLSSFSPIKVLRAEMVKGNQGQLFRRLLVIFQFAITIFLMSSLLVIAFQLDFLGKQDLGFNKDSILVAKNLSRPISRAFPDVTARIEALQGVEVASGTSFLLGGRTFKEVVFEHGKGPEDGTTADILTVDEKFIPMMQIRILEGRNYHPNSELDAQGAYLLNRATIRAIGLQDPTSISMTIVGALGPVIGVVNDFQLRSLHNPVDPVVIRYARDRFTHLYIKINQANQAALRQQITDILLEFDQAWLPDISFLDENLEALYQKERQSATLLWAGSILAILISLLGVYGLAAFTIERRVKEIGIRKILGASMNSLLWIFHKEFFMLLAVAFILAAPLAWWAMQGWLDNFIHRISLQPAWFLIPAFVSFLLTSAIISLRVLKASSDNPVSALRSE